ncbi:MAG: tetratricopeptide repeat protein [Promethearchaeota archaeon]
MSVQSDANSLFAIGREYFTKQAYAKALEVLKPALKQYTELGKKHEAGIVSIFIGRALKALGRHREALVSCSQAVQLLRDTKDLAQLGLALETMGTVLEILNYPKEAASAFDQAAEVYERLGQIKKQLELHLRAGVLLEQLGQLESSYSSFARAVEITKTLTDVDLRFETLSAYARILQQLNDYQQAEITFLKLVQLCTSTNRPVLRAHALLGLASTYISREQLNRAERIIREAEELFAASEDNSGEPYIQYHQARIHLQKDLLNEATLLAERALKRFTEIENALGRVQCHLLLGQIFGKLEVWEKALHHYDEAIELLDVLGNLSRALKTRTTKGKLLLRIGKDQRAEKEFRFVIKHYKESQNIEQEVQVYLELADLMNELGKYKEARVQSRRAIEKLQETQDEEREVLAYLILLKSSQLSDSLEEDRPFLTEGLEKAKAQGKTSVASSLSASLALLSLDIDAPQEEALTVLEEAFRDKFLPKQQRMEIALSLGTALAKQERFVEAVQYLSQVVKDYDNQPDYDKAKTYYQLSDVYRRLNQPEQRRDALEKALASLPQSIDELLQAKILHQLALLIAKEETEKACKYYLLAAKIFEEQDIPSELFEALLGGTTLLVKLRRTKLALQLAEQALTLADELSITMRELDSQTQGFIHLCRAAEVALFAASVHFENHAKQEIIRKMLNWSSRRKSAIILPFLQEKLGCKRCKDLPILLQEEARLIKQAKVLQQKLAQLKPQEFAQQRGELRQQLDNLLAQINENRDMVAEACIDPGKTLPPKDSKILPKVLAMMPQDHKWLLINYDILQKQKKISVAWIDHRGHFGSSLLPLTDGLTAVVSRLRTIQEPEALPSPEQLQKVGTQLFRFLIPTQLAKELRAATYDFVHLVTDDFLHHLPFEIIFDGMQYWGLKYAVSWTPDMIFLENSMRGHSNVTSSTVVLGVKTSYEKHKSGRHIAEEITKTFLASVPISHEHIGEPVVLFGRDFTRDLLIEACDQSCKLLFLSTPTVIHHRKGEIALKHPDSLRAVELGTTTNINGAPALVLDYCIQAEPREDGLSLTAFLRCLKAAGATATIFTRWPPNPNTRAFFAATIATQLHEGKSLAEALQQARQTISIKDTTSNSWLTYTLCGNPYSTLF